jgi:hypothetical protein
MFGCSRWLVYTVAVEFGGHEAQSPARRKTKEKLQPDRKYILEE